MTLDRLRSAVDPDWLRQARQNPRRAFTTAGRALGHRPLPGVPGWSAAEAGRAVLLSELTPDDVTTLYQHGDARERLAVLKAVPLLPVGEAAVPLLHDALRSNDTRLIAAALGPCADLLDQPSWRHGVVKCIFLGIPAESVHRLTERADRALAAMLTALAEERTAAGRPVPADATRLIARFGPLPAAPGTDKETTR